MGVVRRIRARGLRNATLYFLGRFASVRYMSRLARRCFFKGRTASAEVFVEGLHVDEAVSGLRRESVYLGLRLRSDVLAQLVTLAKLANKTVLVGEDRVPATDEVLARADAEGRPPLLVDHESPELIALSRRVAHDPGLMSVAREHLGSCPRNVEVRIQESRVVVATTEYREARNQTVMFHFDVHSMNFLYVFFYLSDVDQDSGAHELVRGSHSKKKISHLFSGARKADAEIYDYYGSELPLVITGIAGTGFIEDTSCFHRALAPTKSSRLAMQIRYS